MIRKAVIVVLTLGAVALVPISWATASHAMLWQWERSRFTWAAGVVEGSAVVLYAASANERMLAKATESWARHIERRTPVSDNGWAFHWEDAALTFALGAVPLPALSLLLAAYPTIAFIRGPLRRWRRRKRGECVECGYNLTGNVTGVCSECGTAERGKRVV